MMLAGFGGSGLRGVASGAQDRRRGRISSEKNSLQGPPAMGGPFLLRAGSTCRRPQSLVDPWPAAVRARLAPRATNHCGDAVRPRRATLTRRRQRLDGLAFVGAVRSAIRLCASLTTPVRPRLPQRMWSVIISTKNSIHSGALSIRARATANKFVRATPRVTSPLGEHFPPQPGDVLRRHPAAVDHRADDRAAPVDRNTHGTLTSVLNAAAGSIGRLVLMTATLRPKFFRDCESGRSGKRSVQGTVKAKQSRMVSRI